MTDSDFASITHDGKLCDAKGQLGLREFEEVMRRQVCVCVCLSVCLSVPVSVCVCLSICLSSTVAEPGPKISGK